MIVKLHASKLFFLILHLILHRLTIHLCYSNAETSLKRYYFIYCSIQQDMIASIIEKERTANICNTCSLIKML